MALTAVTSFLFLLCLVAIPDVVESEPIAEIRNSQFFSRFKCSFNESKVACAADIPAKSYNFSSREQCCLTCHRLGWSWFNFIDNEDQAKSAGGECQLFDQRPKRVNDNENIHCSLYKSDSILLNQTDIESMCLPVSYLVIMYRPSTLSSWSLPWSSYKNGFSLADSSYWVGLERVHQLTSSASYRLRVELLCSGTWTSAEYQSFVIGDEVKTQYTLSISGYAGNLGDRLSYHNGMKFSTTDRDNDVYSGWCAQSYGGGGWWYRGWWYKSCRQSCLTCSSASWSCTASVSRMSIILNA